MSSSVVLMGIKGGPSVLPHGRMPTSNLVQIGKETIVLDCGLGVTRGVTAQGMRLQDLKTIVITHLHSDHYLELGPLIHTAWTCGLKSPVTVYGPSGLPEYWRHFYQSMIYDIDLRLEDEGRPDLKSLVSFEPLEPGVVFDRDGLKMSAIRNHHPPVVESYAISFESADGKIVFSGDTSPFDGIVEFAEGAELLVHEAMLAEGIERILVRTGMGDKLRHHLNVSHSLAEDVGRIATQARVKQLALHHLVPADDPEFGTANWEEAVRRTWSGPLHIGEDGMKIVVAP